MFFTLLQVIQGQCDGFMSSQSASEQQGKQRSVAFTFETLTIRCLFRCQPVAESHAQLFDSLHTPDARCQVGAKKATVGGFVGKTAHGTEAEVDRAGASCRDSK
jgi:hypothetical protein